MGKKGIGIQHDGLWWENTPLGPRPFCTDCVTPYLTKSGSKQSDKDWKCDYVCKYCKKEYHGGIGKKQVEELKALTKNQKAK